MAHKICTCFLSIYAFAFWGFSDMLADVASLGRPLVHYPATRVAPPRSAVILHTPEAGSGPRPTAALNHEPPPLPAKGALHAPADQVGSSIVSTGEADQGAEGLVPHASLRAVGDAVGDPRPVRYGVVALVGAPAPLRVGNPNAIRPLIWLHYPKCGSTFEVSLVHHACGSRIPEDYTLLDPLDKKPPLLKNAKTEKSEKNAKQNHKGKKEEKKEKKEAKGDYQVSKCVYNGEVVVPGWANYSTCKWNSLCGGEHFARFSGGHDPLWLHPSVPSMWSVPTRLTGFRDLWPHPTVGKPFGLIGHVTEKHLSKVVVMVREPRQRVISHYHHALKLGYDVTAEWAFKLYSACMTQLTLGSACGRLGQDSKPFLFGLAEDEARRSAAERVRKFGFVGLTEEWSLSVCMFHTMYGGECLPGEFLRLRPGLARNGPSDYNLTAYRIGEDYKPLDDEVYQVATEVFWTRISQFRITRETCKRVCPRAAEYFN